MNTDLYKKTYQYLIEKKMAFCYLPDGRFISREDCIKHLTYKDIELAEGEGIAHTKEIKEVIKWIDIELA